MKISSILDHIDSGDMALPESPRLYPWYRDQVHGPFESRYRHDQEGRRGGIPVLRGSNGVQARVSADLLGKVRHA